MNPLLQPVRQIAYAVPDVVAAAKEHHRLFGSGPFFLAEHVPVRNFMHRGVSCEFDHTTLFGQWGDIMVEFCTQHNAAPSYIHDMYPHGSSGTGLHHIALIVGDFEQVLTQFNAAGFETASRFYVGAEGAGYDVAFIDTRRINGHMIEIYPGEQPLISAYDMCRKAAGEFSTRPLIEAISF